MWTVQSALKTGPPGNFTVCSRSLFVEDYVTSCTPLYLEQDLYCLATSHGTLYITFCQPSTHFSVNRYEPWPRTVDVNKVPAGVSRKQMIKTQELLATKKNSVLDVLTNLGREDEGGISAKGSHKRFLKFISFFSSHHSRTTVVKGEDASQPTKVLATFTNNLPHGCLRRVVKRVTHPPKYSFIDTYREHLTSILLTDGMSLIGQICLSFLK
jgi:hypothetical protein